MRNVLALDYVKHLLAIAWDNRGLKRQAPLRNDLTEKHINGSRLVYSHTSQKL
jgi:hypothetical protein